MNLATSSLGLAVIASAAAAGRDRRLSGKSSKSNPAVCQDVLAKFNGQEYFGSKANAYTRTILAGDTYLLTIPKKKHVLYDHVCVENGIEELNDLLSLADAVGGCHHQVAGQPSEALGQFRTGRHDVKVATDMVCADAGSRKSCWNVVYGLANATCWAEDYSARNLTATCLPVPEVSCHCLEAYVVAFDQLTSTGKNSFGGADEDTLALVQGRLKESCDSLGQNTSTLVGPEIEWSSVEFP